MSQTDYRSDLYSLGALMHNLVTGIDPRKQPFVFDLPSASGVTIPPAVEAVIMKSLSLKAENRFATAKEMRQELKKAVKESRAAGKAPQPGGVVPVPRPPAAAPGQRQIPAVKEARPVRTSSGKSNPELDKRGKFLQNIAVLIYFVLLFMSFALMVEMGFKVIYIISYFVVAGVLVFFIFKIWGPKNGDKLKKL
jgi:serine/threonine protein kinase